MLLYCQKRTRSFKKTHTHAHTHMEEQGNTTEKGEGLVRQANYPYLPQCGPVILFFFFFFFAVILNTWYNDMNINLLYLTGGKLGQLLPSLPS